MEKRREQLKKNELKKARKNKKDAEDLEQNHKIEIVPNKTMDDYTIDELAETLAIGKKMLRN